MANVIRHPFGGSFGMNVLEKVKATASGSKNRIINYAYSFLRCATASKGKKLTLTVADTVPVGALLIINAQSASSEVLLGTGFVGQTFIGAKTAGKGTGNWISSFIYNGTGFFPLNPMSKLDVSKSS